MNSDGRDSLRLTTGQGIDERPDWSPDGSRIAFSRNGNIWGMEADGTDAARLKKTPREEFAPAYSPNGKRITFNRMSKDGRISIWIMRTDGSKLKRLTFGRLDFFPDWQPQ